MTTMAKESGAVAAAAEKETVAVPKEIEQSDGEESEESAAQDVPPTVRQPSHDDAPSDEPSFLRTILSSSDQITAMLSNFSTNYNVMNISLALPILQSPILYEHSATDETDSLCASSCLAGMVIGQLAGGALGDLAGRMNAMYAVIALQIVASLSSALLVWDGSSLADRASVFDQLALWRFILGIGAGGVYPLAAVLSAEQKSDQDQTHRIMFRTSESMQMRRDQKDQDQKLRMIAITFSMQGVGFLAVPLLTYPLLLVMGESKLDVAWRIVLGLGALPGLILLLLRWRDHRRSKRRGEPVPLDPPEAMETGVSLRADDDAAAEEGVRNGGYLHVGGIEAGENEEPLMDHSHQLSDCDAEEDEVAHNSEIDGEPDVSAELSSQGLLSSIKHETNLVRKLCGTGGTWMLFDILFYGNALFQPIVLEAAFGGSSAESKDDEFKLLAKTARDALLLSLIALPGYFVSTFVMGRRTCQVIHQTPRFIQVQGLLCMAILYAIVGTYWLELKSVQWLLVILYGGTFFFANYGPNTTTFMLPSITYSPACRSTLNGISAASGKAGALLGAAMFEPLADDLGDDRVMLICAGVSVMALILTWACVIRQDQKRPAGSVQQEANHGEDPEIDVPGMT